MLKATLVYLIEDALTRMSKRCMPQIVSQRYSLHQILIQSQCLGYCPGILRHLKCMRHTCAVMVALWCKKHLCLIFQTPECLAMQYPIPVPLKNRPDIALRLIIVPAS